MRLFELLKQTVSFVPYNFHIKICVIRLYELSDKRLEWKTRDFYVENNNVRQLFPVAHFTWIWMTIWRKERSRKWNFTHNCS